MPQVTHSLLLSSISCTDIPFCSYTTYTEAAATAGISRLYAGFHISADNEQGLALGKNVGAQVFRVASAMWDPPKDSDCTASSSSTLHSFLFSLAKKLFLSI